MGFQVIPGEETFGTSIGKGLAAGLGQTLQRGIERGQLSETLRRLETTKQPLLRQFSELSKVTSPETAGMLLPLLQQAQKQDIRSKILGAGATTTTPGATPTTPTATPTQEITDIQATQPNTVAEIISDRAPKYIPNYTEPTYEQKVAEVQSKLGEGVSEDMLQSGLEELDKQLASRTRQQAEYDALLEKSEGKLRNKLEGLNASKDIVGETLDRFNDQLVQDINKGIPVQQAAINKGREALAFAKSRSKLRATLKPNRDIIFGKSDSVRNNITSAKKAYQKFDGEKGLELLRSDLEGRNINPMVAAEMVFPLREQLKKEIDESTPNQALYQRLTDQITDKDSLLSIASAFQSKYNTGLRKSDSPINFLNYIAEQNALGNIDLTDDQSRELQTPMGGVFSELNWGFQNKLLKK